MGAPTQPAGDEAAPESGAGREEVPDDDDSGLPDWRDANLPRYQGGTHRRIEEPMELPSSVVLRTLSVVPFLIVGLLAFLAAVSLLAIVVFGSGSGQSLASWVRGRGGGEIVTGILQLIGLEAACGAVILVCWLALRYGFKAEARRWFWASSATVGAAGAALVVVLRTATPHTLESVSVSGQDWLAPVVLFALMLVTAALRLRRGPFVDRRRGA